MRIDQFLMDQQIPFEQIVHPPAYRAQNRAKQLHISGRQVAKTVLLHAPSGVLVAVLPADRKVSLRLLERALNGPVRLAQESEIADHFLDCEWGAVPPFGSLYGYSTILDGAFAKDEMMVLECHTHMQAIRIRCADFETLEKPRRFRFAIPIQQGDTEQRL